MEKEDKTKKMEKDWEKGFDKEFANLANTIKVAGKYQPVLVNKKLQTATSKEIKSFISSLLAQQRNEIIKEIEEEIDRFIDENDDGLWGGMEVSQNIKQAIKKVGDKK